MKSKLHDLFGPRSEHILATLDGGRRKLRVALLLIGLALALFALTEPRWGIANERIERRGIDLVICLDVSRSMLARDMLPSRLIRAQRAIRDLAERGRGDRFALVAFAGESRLVVPLTRDATAFADLVDLTDPLSVQLGGTDLGAALETACKALDGRSGDHEAVLLLTDGEDHGKRGLRAAEQCRSRNITVHSIGFGSRNGSKIAIEGDDGDTFLRAGSGEEVVSALDASSLRAIADATGGSFIDAGSTPSPLLSLYTDRIGPMTQRVFATEERRQYKNRFQWPLLLAFTLWSIAFVTTSRRMPR